MTMNRVDRFVETARSNGTRVSRSNRKELPLTLAEILREEAGEELVYAPDPEGLLETTLDQKPLDAWTGIPAPPRGSTERFAEAITRTNVGLLCADMGLASRGTVAVRLTSSREGAVSLMPPTTVTLLDARRLHRESRDLFHRFEADLREEVASWVLVAGPSTTADLGSLVQGVHGPSESHVVLMEAAGSR